MFDKIQLIEFVYYAMLQCNTAHNAQILLNVRNV